MGRTRRDWLQRHRIGVVVFVGILIGIAVFRPGPRPPLNEVSWAQERSGLLFHGISQVISEEPIVSRSGAMTVELWLEPGFSPQEGTQEIFSFFDDGNVRRSVVLGQSPRGFILRGHEDNASADPKYDSYIRIDQVGLESPDALQHLALSIGEEGTRLHVNGVPTSLRLPKTVAQPGQAFGGNLLLGSSNTGWRAWRGGINAVAIYERLLETSELRDHAMNPDRIQDENLARDDTLLALYRFEEGEGQRTRSAIPRGPDLTFTDLMQSPTHSNFLTFDVPDRGDRSWLMFDIAFNVLGFLPLGFLIAWKQGLRGVLIALAVGFAFSLSVELLQSQIQGRSSSLIDLGSNSIGASFGGLLGAATGTLLARDP